MYKREFIEVSSTSSRICQNVLELVRKKERKEHVCIHVQLERKRKEEEEEETIEQEIANRKVIHRFVRSILSRRRNTSC
jgi:hypothetical protein